MLVTSVVTLSILLRYASNKCTKFQVIGRSHSCDLKKRTKKPDCEPKRSQDYFTAHTYRVPPDGCRETWGKAMVSGSFVLNSPRARYISRLHRGRNEYANRFQSTWKEYTR